MSRLLLPLMALISFTACFEKEVACDDYAASSALITVLDESGAPVNTATVTASTEDGELDCETWDENGVYVCGYEVSGPFVISIEAEGFE
ncbi:carboxypeptidase-like regulatory domain-containing protein, partial [Myxococcota bacterium]|nr:carboxypeptidase-like regulatory domain-containing protein [Myxococcota bacterium]